MLLSLQEGGHPSVPTGGRASQCSYRRAGIPVLLQEGGHPSATIGGRASQCYYRSMEERCVLSPSDFYCSKEADSGSIVKINSRQMAITLGTVWVLLLKVGLGLEHSHHVLGWMRTEHTHKLRYWNIWCPVLELVLGRSRRGMASLEMV